MDVGKITNNMGAVANTYAYKETNKDTEVKKYNVSGKIIGQPKLSKEAKKSAQKKAEQKRSEKIEREEKLETKLKEKRLSEKKSSKEIITADSVEELKKKIDEYNYSQRANNVKLEEEKTIGSFIDFKG